VKLVIHYAVLWTSLLLAMPAMAEIEWTSRFAPIVIDQVNGANQNYSSDSTARLEARQGSSNSGENYKIIADQQAQATFQLVNANGNGETIAVTVTYADVGLNEQLSDNVEGNNIYPGEANGTTPVVTIDFFVPTGGGFDGFLCGFFGIRCGSSAYGDTFIGFIDFCAFEANSSCGGGGSGNPKSDRTLLPIVFQGVENVPDILIVTGLANSLTFASTGVSSWSASDSFCLGVSAAGNVRIAASSNKGSGAFELDGPTAVLPYNVTIQSVDMVEGVFTSFPGQALADCPGAEGFLLELTADTAVNPVPPGDYIDVLNLLFIPE
jgi:hypothetical protein